jgi:N-acyl-D-aspartate/D-glutamate deacylase
MSDLVITNAFVVDGTGAPARHGDVVVSKGTIVEITTPGAASTTDAKRVIDADGLLLTPGFVDVHTHYDAQVSWDPYLTPSSWHGVTSVVMGNCGVGFAPADPARHEWLIELMEGVEDIPGSAMVEGISWEWESFGEYLDAIDRRSYVLDIGAQIGHGPLRAYVMGERGAANEPASAAEIAAMGDAVRAALVAGALGFSTSRTPLHRSKSGELVPGTTADAAELFGIGDAMAEAGHGVLQYSPEHVALLRNEWGWMRDFTQRTGRTVSVNLNQDHRAPDLWREVLNSLDAAHRDGLNIVAQVAGRSIGTMMCLEGTVHPFLFHRAYREIADLPLAERVAAIRARRRELIDGVADDARFAKAVIDKADRMWAVDGESIDYEPSADTSVAAVAAARGVSVAEVLIDHLISRDGHGMIYSPFFNYAYGDLSMTHELLQHPATCNGLSDAGAHCGAICDGGMPTFMLTHWVRDRSRGPRLGLEHIVARQTSQTAGLYGLNDRGVIAPGFRADFNLLDLDGLGFDHPKMVFDLPDNGRRLVQRARGYRATFVTGVQTVDHDEFTGELPGGLIRGPQHSATRSKV